MQELTLAKIDDVSGGMAKETVVAYTMGLGTSCIIGASLGPFGIAVAAVTYTTSFALTSWLS